MGGMDLEPIEADGARHHRFTCTRMAHEQHAFWNFGAQLNEFLWVFQKFHDLEQFFFGFVSG